MDDLFDVDLERFDVDVIVGFALEHQLLNDPVEHEPMVRMRSVINCITIQNRIIIKSDMGISVRISRRQWESTPPKDLRQQVNRNGIFRESSDAESQDGRIQSKLASGLGCKFERKTPGIESEL